CGNYKGVDMLFADRESTAVAMACSVPFKNRSVGFVGESDGWQSISENKKLTHRYRRAENGNIATCAEIDLEEAGNQPFIVSVGFGINQMEAVQRALDSLKVDYEWVKSSYIKDWVEFQESIVVYSHVLEDGLNLF